MENEKYTLGSYLNLACLNADMILKEACAKFNIEAIETEKEKRKPEDFYKRIIGDLLGQQDKLNYQKAAVEDYLIKHFPFLEVLSNGLEVKLSGLIELLLAMRNYYTHYWHAEVTRDSVPKEKRVRENGVETTKTCLDLHPIYQCLDDLYRISIKEAKNKRFGDGDNRREDTLFIARLKKKYAGDFERNRSTAFDHFRKSNGFQEADKGKVRYIRHLTKPGKEVLSAEGVVFLSCLFLERNSAMKLLAQYFGSQQGMQFEATYWVFTHYCCKPAKRKLQHEEGDGVKSLQEGLMLQMIAELGKCPHELYPYLSLEHREEFVDKRDFAFDDNLGKELELENVQKRFEDKFAYFALRFLDEVGAFKSLRFQVALGNYVRKTKEKKLQGISFERKIHENVRVFDKLGNCDSMEKLKQMCNVPELEPEGLTEEERDRLRLFDENNWEPFAAHYDIRNNQIAVKLTPFTFAQLEENDRTLRSRNVPVPDEQTGKARVDHSFQQDLAFLSVYELPHLVYLVLHEGAEKVEQLIEEKIKQSRALFAHIAAGEQQPPLAGKDIPDCFRPFDNRLDTGTRLSMRINAELEQVKELRAYIVTREKSGIGRGRNNVESYQCIPRGKVGTVAMWLAHDMVGLCGKETRMQIRNYHFNTLQEDLAKFSTSKQALADLCKLLGMVGDNEKQSNLSHPFLHRILFDNRISELPLFFERYLDLKEQALKSDAAEIGNLAKPGVPPKIANKERKKWCQRYGMGEVVQSVGDKSAFYRQKAQSLNLQPVNLSRGLFNDCLRTTLSRVYGVDDAFFQQIFSRRENSFSFTRAIFELHQRDCQAYYLWPRTYCNAADEGDTETITIAEVFSSQAQQLYNRKSSVGAKAAENEKQLRRLILQDTVLLEMIKKIGKTELLGSGDPVFKDLVLKDVFLTKKQKEAEQGKDTEKQVHVLSKYYLFEVKLHGRTITAKLRLKEVGTFRHIMKDSRMENLLDYFPKGKTIPYRFIPAEGVEKFSDPNYEANVLDELHLYEQAQIEIVKQVQDLEKVLHDSTDEQGVAFLNHSDTYIRRLCETISPSFKFEPDDFFPGKLSDKFKRNPPQNESALLMLSVMLLIRNKFSHNEMMPLQTKKLVKDLLQSIGSAPTNGHRDESTMERYMLKSQQEDLFFAPWWCWVYRQFKQKVLDQYTISL